MALHKGGLACRGAGGDQKGSSWGAGAPWHNDRLEAGTLTNRQRALEEGRTCAAIAYED